MDTSAFFGTNPQALVIMLWSTALKVPYIGLPGAPAWWFAEANAVVLLRGWHPPTGALVSGRVGA